MAKNTVNSRFGVLVVISFFGAILSISAAAYMSIYYMAVSHNYNAIELLAPSQDVILMKIDDLLTNHEAKNLIVNEIKSRHNQQISLHGILANVVMNNKTYAFWNAVLWCVSMIVFFILAVIFQNQKGQNH